MVHTVCILNVNIFENTISYQIEKLCVSPEQPFYRRYYEQKKEGTSEQENEIKIKIYCNSKQITHHYLAIISFSLLEEWPPLPSTFAGVDKK